jgi:Zn-dependent M28 family amino/carboxypeptidase
MGTLAAVNVILHSGLKPKRTIRIVFWVNEENGGAGGKAYRAALTPEELKNHVAAIEMDGGAEQPTGYGFGSFAGLRRSPGQTATKAPEALTVPEQHSMAMLQDIATLLTPVGASTIKQGGGGSDISPLTADGVPSLGEMTTGAHYFDWHHTEADTLDKVNPEDFRKNVASLAVMTYILADMPETLTGHKGPAEE